MPTAAPSLLPNRLKNALQHLLILAGLALVLAVPGYLLAGLFGVIWCFALVALTLYLSGRVPARVVLANASAGLLRRHQAPELYRVLDALYRHAGLTAEPLLFYSPSPGLNAFAVGDRHDGGIAITEGLIRTLNLRQLGGVLAHEVSHLRHGDTRVMSMAATMTRLTIWGAFLVQLGLVMMLPLVMAGEIDMPWRELLVVGLTPTLSTLLQLALSRNREYTADLEAVALTHDPRGLASALAVLERHDSLWLTAIFGRQPPAWLRYLQTHPPTRERIRRLLALDGRAADGPAPRREPPPEAPVVISRPDAQGRRYWILRRR